MPGARWRGGRRWRQRSSANVWRTTICRTEDKCAAFGYRKMADAAIILQAEAALKMVSGSAADSQAEAACNQSVLHRKVGRGSLRARSGLCCCAAAFHEIVSACAALPERAPANTVLP